MALPFVTLSLHHQKPPKILGSSPQKHSHILSRPNSETQSPPCKVQAPDPTFTITGGAQLSGHVPISGSKNSALSILAATLCCSGTSKIRGVPNLSDTRTMASVLRSLGAEVGVRDGEMSVSADMVGSVEPCAEEIGKIRGGFFVIGPLLARFGEAAVALPGGCDIGARPVDLYIRGLRALGAIVELRDGKVQARAANGRGLVGGRFKLDYPSVGATETLMMAASMADGVTVLSNVAREPEVIDLARFLTGSGACVEGAGSDTLLIKGKSQLHGSECVISPDRIEAGTFMLAAAITRSSISMSPVIPSHLACLSDKLLAAGCKIGFAHDTLEVSAVPAYVGDNLRGFDVRACPFPGFPTDLQPQATALLTTCTGLSIVEETVFENRMSHVVELRKLGARIQVRGSTAFVSGREKESTALLGSHLVASDLRGGAALVLAGLAAEGVTEISGSAHIDRGYESIDTKLRFLGAGIKKSIPLWELQHQLDEVGNPF